MNIDWSKAPEGATHARKHAQGIDFYKRECSLWLYFTSRGKWDIALGTDETLCEARPNQWTGEGLPPVGTVCAIECETPHKRWKKHVGEQVVIIAHSTGYEGNPTAVYKVFNAEDSEYHALREQAFRPIRTPEQIAAEAHQKNINDLADQIGGYFGFDDSRPSDLGLAKYLMDQGYGKFEIVDA